LGLSLSRRASESAVHEEECALIAHLIGYLLVDENEGEVLLEGAISN
jgi:hypothetical protein